MTAVITSSSMHGLYGFREPWVLGVLVALVALAIAGAIDDISPLPVLPRLALQLAVASLLVAPPPHKAGK